MTGRRLAFAGVAVMVALCALPVCAQTTSAQLSNAEIEPYFFVPDLDGAVVGSAGMTSRRVDRGDALSLAFPDFFVAGELGYRLYADDIGRWAIGAALTGATSIPGLDGVVNGRLSHFGVGLNLETRLMSPSYVYLLLGIYGEAGYVLWRPPSGDRAGESPDAGEGYRVAGGIQSGVGMLTWLDPYVYAEVPIFFGFELMEIGGMELSSFHFGIRVTHDFAHR